ncbi:MAG: putative flagellar hook-associated protein 3 [Paenibacillus sp.]|jgi:flagellar hook-associated protein 3 FlgL|nr:putative flagellar hook-associated protein 3 [Paenibacillus sp.]
MIRITTNGVLRGYKSNLTHSSNQLDSARNKVLTQRNFNSFAEDPAAATQAFKLRRSFSRVSDQITNSTDLISKFESAYTAIGTAKNLVQDAANNSTLRAVSDPTGSGRQPLGQVLSSTAKSIIQTMNVEYNDSFVFAGNDAQTVPFSWDSSGNLLYRGISVDAGGVGVRPEGTPPDPSKEPTTSSWGVYYASNQNFAKLAQMSYETAYVDVGAGLSEDSTGTLNSASAFNSALSGLNLLGFGLDADGDPKNAVSITKKLSDIFLRCDADGKYASTTDKENASRLSGKLQQSLASLTKNWTAVDGEAQYLNNNKESLTDYSDTLNTEILSIEQVNLADAITDLSWAQYCYNASLKVGNQILSQSLIDYMN